MIELIEMDYTALVQESPKKGYGTLGMLPLHNPRASCNTCWVALYMRKWDLHLQHCACWVRIAGYVVPMSTQHYTALSLSGSSHLTYSYARHRAEQ